MSTHPDLGSDEVERLRAELGVPSPPNQAAGTGPRVRSDADVVETSGRAKAWIRRALSRAVRSAPADRVLSIVSERVASRLDGSSLVEAGRLDVEVALLAARLEALAPALHTLQSLGVGAEIVTASTDLHTQQRSFDVNQSLFSSELAEFRAQLERLGQAIAPAAGLAGVADRFAELRERVNSLDRRVSRRADPSLAAATSSADEQSPGTAADTTPGFDYVDFERRFRGDSDTVLSWLGGRYADLLAEHQPVLDFGCGRGELVALLRERGVDAVGVDPDIGMIEEAAAEGLPIEAADGIEWLRARPERSLGSIISVHVVEHLRLEVLVEFLELAASRLQPGGIFVAETPNPTSLIVLGNSYILDPTHVWPLHPSLLTFLCERAGFRDVEQRFYAPAEAYHLPRIDVDSTEVPAWAATINEAFAQLDHTLFGPQEYAVVATMPPG